MCSCRLGALESLRALCATTYDAEDASHVRKLKDLWAAAFPSEPYALPSQRWKDLGFQGTDPRTDLRGAGYLGLVQLHALITQHGAGMLGLEEDLPPELSQLPLAIASINCTAMLLSHLQLAPKLATAFVQGGRILCSDETLQAFLALGWEGEDAAAAADGGAEHAAAVRRLEYVLQALHVRLALHLGRVWRRMSAEPHTTIMDFPAALRETCARAHHLVPPTRAGTSTCTSAGAGRYTRRCVDGPRATPPSPPLAPPHAAATCA